VFSPQKLKGTETLYYARNALHSDRQAQKTKSVGSDYLRTVNDLRKHTNRILQHELCWNNARI
jgi:hypothetical protein